MTLEGVLIFFSLFTPALGIKIFLLTFIFFYGVFAVVVLRQTQLMSKILDEEGVSPFLKFLAAVQLLAAVAILFLAILLL